MTRPEVGVASIEEWESWLRANHETSDGIWLVTQKKGRPGYIGYDELVDVAICFGWVDGQARGIDHVHSARLVTPRRRGSSWSRVNKRRVERLTAEGRMQPAGLAAVDLAQHDGTWTALDAVEDLVEPEALRAGLNAVPTARLHWDAFPRSAKRAILEWIGSAKTDPTRDKRIATTVAEAAENRRANQWRPKR